MRYCWKLSKFTACEKTCAQKCLTVSNIKLDDVLGNVATAITTRLLWKPNERTRGIPFNLTKA